MILGTTEDERLKNSSLGLDTPFPTAFARWVGAGTARWESTELFQRHARGALDLYKMWPDKTLAMLSNGQAACAYPDTIGARLVLGMPAGAPPLMGAAIDAVEAKTTGRTLAFVAIDPDCLPRFRRRRYTLTPLGEEAIVDLNYFIGQTTRSYAIARYAQRFAPNGFTTERSEPPHTAALLNDLDMIIAGWLAIPRRRNLGFAAGSYSHDYMNAVPVHILRGPDMRAHAFVSELPTVGRTAAVDLIRRSPDAPGGAVDYLIQKALHHAWRSGAARCSLGLAPIASRSCPLPATRTESGLACLARHAAHALGFHGLHRFKAKFEPEWEPRYLAVRGGAGRTWHAMVALYRAINNPTQPS